LIDFSSSEMHPTLRRGEGSKGGKEGEREEGREGRRERGRGREGAREGRREEGTEAWREKLVKYMQSKVYMYVLTPLHTEGCPSLPCKVEK